MRYLHLLICFLILIFSKQCYDISPKVDIDTHQKIHRDLENVLRYSIQTASPNAEDIEFQYVRSRALNPDLVEVYFSVSFVSPDDFNVKIILEGSSSLERHAEDGSNKWSIQSFILGDEQIEFQEEIIIEVDRSKLTNE